MSDIKIDAVEMMLTYPSWKNGDRCPDNLGYKFFHSCNAVLLIDGVKNKMTIPAGFWSDGGTIPRSLGFMRGLAWIGYFFHDLVYTNHQFDRETCDQILCAFLEWEGVDKADITAIYAGVRVFGGSHYDED